MASPAPSDVGATATKREVPAAQPPSAPSPPATDVPVGTRLVKGERERVMKESAGSGQSSSRCTTPCSVTTAASDSPSSLPNFDSDEVSDKKDSEMTDAKPVKASKDKDKVKKRSSWQLARRRLTRQGYMIGPLKEDKFSTTKGTVYRMIQLGVPVGTEDREVASCAEESAQAVKDVQSPRRSSESTSTTASSESSSPSSSSNNSWKGWRKPSAYQSYKGGSYGKYRCSHGRYPKW